MTVTAVLLNFWVALLGLLPTVERVGIPWKRAGAYDEWDAIASVLFKNLVQEVLRWHLPEDNQADFDLPEYDLLLSTYAGPATLEVVHPSLQPGRWLFYAFGTDNGPFDGVGCVLSLRVAHHLLTSWENARSTGRCSFSERAQGRCP